MADMGRFKSSIGSTDATSGEYLVETVVDDSSSDDDDMSASDSDEEEDLDEQGLINLDEIISATHAGKPKGVDPVHEMSEHSRWFPE